MEKNVTAVVKLEELALRQKSLEMNAVFDAKFFRKSFQLWLQRTLSGNRKFCFGMPSDKNRKGLKARRQTFFRN